MRGCEDLQGTIERKLGIGPGEKTPDDKFSFELVECLGSCGTAPMMRMNNRYWENLTVEKLERIIDACRDGRDPSRARTSTAVNSERPWRRPSSANAST